MDTRGDGVQPDGGPDAAGDRDTGGGADAARLDALLPRLKRLEESAFTELYDLMAPQLLTYSRGLVGGDELAADVVQDTFLRLVRHVRRFRGDGRALLRWLYTTARNRCADHGRRRRRRRELPTDELPETATPLGAPAPDPEAVSDPELDRAMAALTEAQRTAILLRRVLGYSGEEVGAIMGIDREAVYALCARGEARLRQLLRRTATGPDVRGGGG